MSKTESSCGQAYRKTAHPINRGGWQGWERTEVADTLNEYDISEKRVPVIVLDTAIGIDLYNQTTTGGWRNH